MENLKVARNFQDVIKLVKDTSRRDRNAMVARGRQGIEDGQGVWLLRGCGVDPISAQHMAPQLADLGNNPPPEMLVYLICALCALPQAVVSLTPKDNLWRFIRQQFKRVAVREDMEQDGQTS